MKRFVAEFSHIANAAPDFIFPLLCPTRELEWIPGWNCNLIYSVSGFAEKNCIFTTFSPDRGEGTYIVTHYDPERFNISFAIFYPQLLVETLDITVNDNGDGSSTLKWQRTYTGINQQGELWASQYVNQSFESRMQFLAESMNNYIEKQNAA